MKWGRIEHPDRDVHMCEETGWVVFESNMNGHWLGFMAGENDAQDGPYENEAEAKKWAERLEKYSQQVAEEDRGDVTTILH
jgi:hypothetical protein